MIKHIKDVRGKNSKVTFSWEHPTGIVYQKLWFKDFIELKLRRTHVNCDGGALSRATPPSITRRVAGLYVQALRHKA